MSHLPFNRGEIETLLTRAGEYAPEVRERLEWFLHFAESQSISATCRRFGIARTTFYRWARRFDTPTFPVNSVQKKTDVPVQQFAPAVPAGSEPMATAEVTVPQQTNYLHAWKLLLVGVVSCVIINLLLVAMLLSVALWERVGASVTESDTDLKAGVLSVHSSLDLSGE